VKQGQLPTPVDIPVENLYTCSLTFLLKIIFGELTSATSNKTVTTDIIFVGATPIN